MDFSIDTPSQRKLVRAALALQLREQVPLRAVRKGNWSAFARLTAGLATQGPRVLAFFLIPDLLIKRQRTANVSLGVVIATKDRFTYLLRALGSIAIQKVLPLEVVVVNDGIAFTETQLHQLRVALPQKCLLQVLASGGQGVAAARELGQSATSANLIAYLDDDNLFYLTWIKQLERLYLRENPDLVYGAQIRRHAGEVFFKKFHLDSIRVSNYIDTSSLSHKKDIGHWDPEIRRLNDWDFVLTCLSGEIDVVSTPGFSSIYTIDAPNRITRSKDYEHWRDVVRHKHGLTS